MGDLYVLGNAEGAFYYPDRLTKEFASVIKMLGLVGITGKLVTLHDLRHTYATYLVAVGTDIKTVSSLMGHANAAMTLNTYASTDPHAKRSAVKTIEQQMAARPPHDEVGRVIRVVQAQVRRGNLLEGVRRKSRALELEKHKKAPRLGGVTFRHGLTPRRGGRHG
jgi:hypothetical protein